MSLCRSPFILFWGNFIQNLPYVLPTKLLFILATRFHRIRFFRNQPIRNKNCLWWSLLWTDRDKMSNLYRGPSIDASYQVSVHLAKRFQRRRYFRNRPIRNKNCLWWPCLLTNWAEVNNLYREPSIDASYQVSVHLAKWFHRRRLKCEKFTDGRTPSDGNNSRCLWQGELKSNRAYIYTYIWMLYNYYKRQTWSCI